MVRVKLDLFLAKLALVTGMKVVPLFEIFISLLQNGLIVLVDCVGLI